MKKFTCDLGLGIRRGGINGTSLQLREENGESVAHLADGEKYAIELTCGYGTRYRITVWLDGRKVASNLILSGKYQGEVSALERGTAGDDGIFTFYALGSAGGNAVGLSDISADKLGLVEVMFEAGRRSEPQAKSFGGDTYRGATRSAGGETTRSAGGSGSSGHSSQTFGSTTFEVDPTAPKVVLSLRLKLEEGPRPLAFIA